ncbi:MAG: hypothetical protein ABI658_19655 [Acidimicrobiales bacterium]
MLMIDAELTLDELTELALAADPHEHLEPDAVPLAGTNEEFALLPRWYMPAPIASSRTRSLWHVAVAIFLVSAFVIITALGFCITYGRLEGV